MPVDPPQGTSRRHVVQAINPEDGKTIDVLYPSHRLQWARSMGIGAIMEISDSVKQVLTRPTAVFSGILRDTDDDRGQTEGWLCYVGKPSVRYDLRTGVKVEVADRVLLVYINRESTYYNHRWEKESSSEPGKPEDTEVRFKDQPL